jgi:hypothetical protein
LVEFLTPQETQQEAIVQSAFILWTMREAAYKWYIYIFFKIKLDRSFDKMYWSIF